MNTKVAIYRILSTRRDESIRSFTLYPSDKVTIPSNDVMGYLRETNPALYVKYMENRPRWRSARLYRIANTPSFKRWAESNSCTLWTELYGYASCDHDSRLSSSSVRVALLHAVQNDSDEVKIYPQTIQDRVYVTRLHLTLV